MTDEMFRVLRDIICEMTGILYDESKLYLLESRIRRRLVDLGLGSFDEYLKIVHNFDSHPEEKEVFIDLVTTHETSFFRNAPQLDILVNDVAPAIFAKARERGQSEIKIWSAGCSTGEEPYNIVMMMAKCGVLPDDLKVRIMGTDISSVSIETAKRGMFDSYSLRNVPHEYLNKYFTQVDDKKFMVADSILNSVEFCQLNLLDTAGMSAMCDMDIVLCRNVFIYFHTGFREKVAELLCGAIRDNGFLFIGHSESFYDMSKFFTLETKRGVPVYRKRGAGLQN